MAKCHSISCTGGEILGSDNHVEVRTVLPSATELRKLRSKLAVRWKRNGEAVFHRLCWDSLLKAARARKNHPNLPKLVAGEKLLILEANKTVECFDSQDVVKQSARKCAQLIKKSKHFTAFTGAGISTSAGIGDFRGKSGKWTSQDQSAINMDGVFQGELDEDESGDESPSKKLKRSQSDDSEECEDTGGVSYEQLRPTYTHEALQKLVEKGFLKYIISQNGDGLHGLSGVPSEKLSELHGNVFVELCEKCKTRYSRSYYVMDDTVSQYYEEVEDYGRSSVGKPSHAKRCTTCGLSHRTGRSCEKKGCDGYLMDSIINFGDNLEEDVLKRAEENAQKTDLMICLGSTLTVTPASDLVEMGKEPLDLIICNRQKTHMDKHINDGVRVFGDCDVFMREVMRGVLEPGELTEWEDGREKRMKHYMSLRSEAV